MKILPHAAAALALAAALQAQPLVESLEVRVSNVDVVVTDRAGKPVTGLTRDDFEVFEGSKPQPITNFYEIRESTEQGSAGEPVPGALAAEVPAEISRRRLVIVVDNYSIHPIARNRAFTALAQSLESLMRPGDEAMIVFWNGRREVIAPFTSDRAALVARFREAARQSAGGLSIEAARSRIIEHASQMLADAKAPGTRKISFQQAYAESYASARAFAEELLASETALLQAVRQTLTSLAGVEGKKALIFLGAELPDNPGMELFQQIDGMFQSYVQGISPAPFREQGRNLGAELRKLARHANANGVTMYLVDSSDRLGRSDPTSHAAEGEAIFAAETNTPMAMAMIASITGGIAVPGGKSFEKALTTIARDLSSYYSLGYRSPEADGDRSIVVKVKNRDYRVRSRRSYVARKADDEVRDRVIANIFHSGVASNFPVRVALGSPEKQPDGQYKVQLTVTFPSTLTLIPQEDSIVGEFAVFFATGKEDGALSDVTKAVQPMKFPANAREAIEAQKTFSYTATLLVRPGEQIVSVGVADAVGGTSGYARGKVVAQ